MDVRPDDTARREPPLEVVVRNRAWVVSWLRAASLAFPVIADQWRSERSALTARYSGGAAPAFHRLPYPVLTFNCLSRRVRNTAKLSWGLGGGKRAVRAVAAWPRLTLAMLAAACRVRQTPTPRTLVAVVHRSNGAP